jgi:small-conductance mechanosensitive channel
MAQQPSIGAQIATLWRDTIQWIDDHTASILLALIMGGALVTLLYGLKWVGAKLAKSETPWRNILGKALASMRFWFMAAVAAQIVARYAHAPAEMAEAIRFIFVIAAAFQAALILRALILGVVEVRAGEADPSGNLGSAIGLIRLFVTIALFIIATILVLSNLGVNVTGLVAGLGIGGIAIGLAAQGIFADLFAALSILFDKPFRRGDIVRYENTVGTVEAIGLKSTRIRSLTGEEVVISNTNLLSKELRNLARNERRRVMQPLGLVYQTDPAQCEALANDLASLVEAVEQCSFVRCTLDSFGPSSLDFMLVYDIATEDQDAIAHAKHAVNLGILRHFDAKQIAFAYPTQTTYTAAPDGTLVMPWAQPAAVPSPRKAR